MVVIAVVVVVFIVVVVVFIVVVVVVFIVVAIVVFIVDVVVVFIVVAVVWIGETLTTIFVVENLGSNIRCVRSPTRLGGRHWKQYSLYALNNNT